MLLQLTNVSAKTFIYRITRFFTLVCDVQLQNSFMYLRTQGQYQLKSQSSHKIDMKWNGKELVFGGNNKCVSLGFYCQFREVCSIKIYD